MDKERTRRPHVVMDRETRVMKARKIVALVGLQRFAQARKVLEIGCGSGVIASTLSELGHPDLEVEAVDVVDSRIEVRGYAFQQVDGTSLPFDAGRFDLVVSNHVIEHVGPRDAQLQHLGEIRRVLNPSGIAYLAVPNKWRLVEPHFRLPLLSWLPQSASDAYVRLMDKGSHYDCLPLSTADARALFYESGLAPRDVTMDALRATLEIEMPGSLVSRTASHMPMEMLGVFKTLMPTLIFLLRATHR